MSGHKKARGKAAADNHCRGAQDATRRTGERTGDSRSAGKRSAVGAARDAGDGARLLGQHRRATGGHRRCPRHAAMPRAAHRPSRRYCGSPWCDSRSCGLAFVRPIHKACFAPLFHAAIEKAAVSGRRRVVLSQHRDRFDESGAEDVGAKIVDCPSIFGVSFNCPTTRHWNFFAPLNNGLACHFCHTPKRSSGPQRMNQLRLSNHILSVKPT